MSAVPTTEGNLCPDCQTPLTPHPAVTSFDASVAVPWCGACEWNLDHTTEDPRLSRFWRRMVRSDRRAGFASHKRLATSAELSPVGERVFRMLTAISAALMLVMVGAIGVALWLIVGVGPFFPIVLGLLLLGFAALLRPRYTRLKRLMTTSYRVEPGNAPTIHAVLDRIAARCGAPKPDVLLFDFSWSAGVTTVGPRPQRVLGIGVPLMLALEPQELVAVIGHEMGHLRYADVRRLMLTAPARNTFGRLSRLFRPPLLSAAEMGLGGIEGIAMIIWQIVGGTISSLLYAAHVGVNVFAAHDDRTVELRADDMAAEAAGSVAALRALDLLATLPALTTYVQRYVPEGEAAVTWRRMLRSVREREAPTAPAWRQLSIRTQASLFASHPPPGRRHQWLAARPARDAAVLLTESEAEALEREIRPYAEALHRTMLKAHPEDDR